MDRDAALMACADLPADKVLQVISGYLSGRKLEQDYGPFLDTVRGVVAGLERNGGGREMLAFQQLLPDITALVDENIRCQQMARDAMALTAKVDAIVAERHAEFMAGVKQVLQQYLTSGTVGMRALAQEFMDSIHAAGVKAP